MHVRGWVYTPILVTVGYIRWPGVTTMGRHHNMGTGSRGARTPTMSKGRQLLPLLPSTSGE